MRILCTGDWHLGAGADYGAHPGDRLADQAKVCDRIVEIAREEGVSAVLFAGDAFERRTPTPAELMVWRGFVEQLDALRIPLHSIVGNHDVARADLPTAMEVVDPVSRTPVVYHLGEGMALATLPWTPPAELIAARGGGDRDDLNEQVAEHLIEAARGLRNMIDGPAILLGHWSVEGAALPNGLDVSLLREPVLDVDALVEQDWDAVVLGHIHKWQSWGRAGVEYRDRPGVIAYVGSPMPLNFGEANDEHGVGILTVEDDGAGEWVLVPIESRPFVTVSVDLTSTIPFVEEVPASQADPRAMRYEDIGLDETDVIAAAIATHLPLTDAVVRIRYKATAEQARRVDQGALRELVMNAGTHKLYAIQAEVTRSDRARVAGVDESLDVEAALDRWLTSEGVDESQAEALRVLTARYLEETKS